MRGWSSGAQPVDDEPRLLGGRDDLELDAESPRAPGRGRRRNWRPAGTPRSRHSGPRRRCAGRSCRRRLAAPRCVRAIAASDSAPVAASPSPSRTMRENASTTRKPRAGPAGDQQPAIVGAEIERGIARPGRPRRRRDVVAAADPAAPRWSARSIAGARRECLAGRSHAALQTAGHSVTISRHGAIVAQPRRAEKRSGCRGLAALQARS